MATANILHLLKFSTTFPTSFFRYLDFCSIRRRKNTFWPISQKLSTIEHMLLHNTNINVAIAHILTCCNSLYDLHKPRYIFSLKIIKISGALAQNLNTSIIECLSTFKPPFVYHNVTIAVILHPMWCFHLQREAKIGIFQVHSMCIKLPGAVAHFLYVRFTGILLWCLLRP